MKINIKVIRVQIFNGPFFFFITLRVCSGVRNQFENYEILEMKDQANFESEVYFQRKDSKILGGIESRAKFKPKRSKFNRKNFALKR